MKSFKSFTDPKPLPLQEGNLGAGEIQKYDWRIKLFLDKLDKGEEFETVDGKKVVLEKTPELVKYVKEGGAPRGYKFKTMDGQELSFTKLQKTDEFGGGSRGSGGGSDSTRATESAQCVYLKAIWDDANTDFSPEVIQTSFQLVDTDASLKEVMGIDQEWVHSSRVSAQLLKKALGRRTGYEFHRGSSLVDKIEKKFKELNRKEKAFNNLNKWSPADIYIVDPTMLSKYDIDGAQSIDFLNNEMRRAYQARDIIGVSLKKVEGKPKLVQVNYKKPFQPPKFDSITYGKKSFFKAKDGYIFFDQGGEIQFRTYPTFQCEIIGKTAKHGKVSEGMIDTLMQKVGAKPLTLKADLLRLWRKDNQKFYEQMHALYMTTGEPAMDLKTFISNLKGKDDNWLTSKYMVMDVFTKVRGREQEFLNLLIRYAKSESPNSCVHLKVK
jgi:hypothetical protein